MELKIPASLRHQHGELHAELEAATNASGSIGEAAREVARLLYPHFMKEEEYALPPLGLLAELAGGAVPAGAEIVISMTDRLKRELNTMLQEHAAIVAALEKLIAAATVEQRPEYARFARKLMLHAKNEEEVLYPASMLIGAFMTVKTGRS